MNFSMGKLSYFMKQKDRTYNSEDWFQWSEGRVSFGKKDANNASSRDIHSHGLSIGADKIKKDSTLNLLFTSSIIGKRILFEIKSILLNVSIIFFLVSFIFNSFISILRVVWVLEHPFNKSPKANIQINFFISKLYHCAYSVPRTNIFKNYY